MGGQVQAAIQPRGLEEIKAVQFASSRVITAGQPSAEQFPRLKASGVDLVINLIPAGNASGLANEAELVAAAGMSYAHIGVDWNAPSNEDLARFLAVMDANQDKDVLIHCAANYRASAFYYLYLLHTGASDSDTLQRKAMAPWGDLEEGFKTYPQWHKLIEEAKRAR
ncbi:hypothetical protein FCL40_03800 [Ferrimonas sediminicola]|uniref:TIGR01244 family protein n=2 Tax=Ferrimonas sediminicola TaxID=2569538 RepID=A0A4U1BJF5_9GAMM|nr:hypothetical protein FCL40_03800 [Ferrimonas sediminicola]